MKTFITNFVFISALLILISLTVYLIDTVNGKCQAQAMNAAQLHECINL